MESREESYKQLLISLPKEQGWVADLLQYQGFWYPPQTLPSIFTCQSHFRALDSDILLVTAPKSGTTWLKALLFAIVNRHLHPIVNSHPLTSHNPHDLVPFLELRLYVNVELPDLSSFPSPRLFATHLPVVSLPASVLASSSCKIVYLCRDPRDMFISLWHFHKASVPFEEAFDKYCKGVHFYGPFWDHVLGYWKESLKEDSKVLFLKYEDMKADPTKSVRRLAEFLGCPFSEAEEKDGVVEMIVDLCCFESLKNLEVNKNGKQYPDKDNKMFFRRGEVGDWANYLTPEMARRLDKVIEDKLRDSGLTF